ncbi:MAG: methylenetetrahydrofolate reductase, partial [Candidatus Hodgkinia cicadicola]
LVSAIFIQYLPMWSFMHHIITIDVIPNGMLSILTLRGDKNSNIQVRTERKYISLRSVFKNFSLYPDVHPTSSGNIHDALLLVHRASIGGSCIITQFCFNTENWMRLAYQSSIFGNIKLIAGIFAPSYGRFGIRMALQNGIYIPYWLKQMLKVPTRRNSLIGLLSFVGNLMAQDVRFFHFYTMNKPRVMTEVLWILSSIRLRYGLGD